MGASERVVFRGVTFRRYPDSKNWADRWYFTPGVADRQRGVGRLHQEIWKAANGSIPKGHHVHHRDENPLNNDLDNLECLPGREHNHNHSADSSPEVAAARLAGLVAGRERAAEWHRSEEGRAWHREHGKRVWDGRQAEVFTCEQCGAEYQSRAAQGHNRFCSNNCKTKWRKASGVDDEDRACAFCGNTFRINKYAVARACSRVCGQGLRRQRAAS
ncbi:HNH endonuclease signature motif containing protein [Streptomyces noursei]